MSSSLIFKGFPLLLLKNLTTKNIFSNDVKWPWVTLPMKLPLNPSAKLTEFSITNKYKRRVILKYDWNENLKRRFSFDLCNRRN